MLSGKRHCLFNGKNQELLLWIRFKLFSGRIQEGGFTNYYFSGRKQDDLQLDLLSLQRKESGKGRWNRALRMAIRRLNCLIDLFSGRNQENELLFYLRRKKTGDF
jgi:hypothetical protein